MGTRIAVQTEITSATPRIDESCTIAFNVSRQAKHEGVPQITEQHLKHATQRKQNSASLHCGQSSLSSNLIEYGYLFILTYNLLCLLKTNCALHQGGCWHAVPGQCVSSEIKSCQFTSNLVHSKQAMAATKYFLVTSILPGSGLETSRLTWREFNWTNAYILDGRCAMDTFYVYAQKHMSMTGRQSAKQIVHGVINISPASQAACRSALTAAPWPSFSSSVQLADSQSENR